MQFLMENWPLVAGLLATGVVAGVLAGLLGVGGGIVIVPVLFQIFGVLGIEDAIRMQLAVGTSLATIIPTSIRSLRSHAKRGAVDWSVLKTWTPGLLVGVALGSAVAGFVDGRVLVSVFAVVALLVAANMSFGGGRYRLGEELPSGAGRFAMTTGVGGVSALMGIGGGTLGVPIMSLFGFPAQRAVATASGLGLIISIPGTIGFILAGQGAQALPAGSLGFVNLIGFALITPMTILAAPWGVRISHAISKERLSQLFALFLAITSARMFMSLLG
ncbi:MAG: sulfite exporter TauE/SafE family protein [Pseudomonadota bacterium]